MLTQPKNTNRDLDPNSYELEPNQTCWIDIKNVSIHVQHHNEGFSFDLYNNTTDAIIKEHFFYFPTEQ